jgi:chaperone required for assembly of F1-ATPase
MGVPFLTSEFSKMLSSLSLPNRSADLGFMTGLIGGMVVFLLLSTGVWAGSSMHFLPAVEDEAVEGSERSALAHLERFFCFASFGCCTISHSSSERKRSLATDLKKKIEIVSKCE